MNGTDLLGYFAAILTTVSFLPQAIKALRDRDTKSLSLSMYVIFTTGVVMWGIYGLLRHDWAIVAANAVTSALSLAILITKIRYDVLRQTGRPAKANSAV